jgi:hypothetical protein
VTVDSLQIDRTGPGYTYETVGIMASGTTGKVADYLTVTNCNIFGNSPTYRFKMGIEMYNTSAAGYAGGFIVKNNVVDVSTCAIDVLRGAKAGITKTEISGNTCSLNGLYSGGYTHFGIQLENWQDTINIFNNKLVTLRSTNTYTSGLTMNGIRTYLGQTANNTTVNIYNNFISDLQVSSSRVDNTMYGINVHSTTTINCAVHNIYFNTVILNNDYGNTSGRMAALRIANNTTVSTYATVVNLKNNILMNSILPSRALSYAIDCQKDTKLGSVDYNNLYADTVATDTSLSCKTLAQWQTATGKDAHSKSVNPANPFGGLGQLKSLTDPHWMSQPVFAFAGTPIPGITKDIDGDTRNATNPYMGADENATALGVGQELGSGPRQFTLEQNYPNPFNPSTTISYSVPQAGLVSLKVYDLLGREVATLLNEIKSAGTYSVPWNALTNPSGIYFYKLTAGGFSETHKMQLIK